MTRHLFAASLAVAVCMPLVAAAQGSFVQAELETAIKAKKAKVGDPVKAKAINSATLANGMTVASGSEILGQVRSVEPDSVAISFDEVQQDGKKTPVALSIRAALMPGTATKSMGDAGSAPAADHPMSGRPRSPSDKAGTAAPSAPADTGGASQPARKVAAAAGTVIGMPGVALEIDEGPQHASKFRFTGNDPQLKRGLQLMLGPPEP